MMRLTSRQWYLAAGLLVCGVLARWVPHPPNVTPVVAIALFSGALFPRPWAWSLPLALVLISDAVIGFHEVIWFTWPCVALTGVVGSRLGRQLTSGRLVCSALASSVLFFLVTNFGVWLVGGHGAMYPKTLDGLWSCYIAALPFFRNALIGDLAYTLGLFGLWAWGLRLSAVPASVAHPTSRPVP